MPTLQARLDLPPGFRVADILEFHHRDGQAVAERVGAGILEKGLIWHGHAACLTVNFHDHHVATVWAVDNGSTVPHRNPPRQARFTGGGATADDLANLVRRMLGLNQAIDEFEHAHRQHPQLGALITRQAGLRVPLAATPFEALTWAITGQQISVRAAVSMRRKLIQAAGVVHSSGLACYPDARRLATLSEADLRAAGFSQSKAQTLLSVSRRVLAGELPLDGWLSTLPVEEIRQQLLAIRGIGPWTVNYTLLRGFGWLDGSLHGDAAVRRSLQTVLAAPEKISEAAAAEWLAKFSPWRALLCAHLWANLSVKA